jgi:hypothetical protein
MRPPTCQVLAILLVFGSIADARAQGVSQQNTSRIGGTATTGIGVKTGRGPLSQRIPPAVSTANPQNPNRPQNMQGPAQTSPSQQPFGSR